MRLILRSVCLTKCSAYHTWNRSTRDAVQKMRCLSMCCAVIGSSFQGVMAAKMTHSTHRYTIPNRMYFWKASHNKSISLILEFLKQKYQKLRTLINEVSNLRVRLLWFRKALNRTFIVVRFSFHCTKTVLLKSLVKISELGKFQNKFFCVLSRIPGVSEESELIR